MKKTVLLILLFLSSQGYAQTKLPQLVINEYANQCYYHSKYGTDAFRAFFYRGMQGQGYYSISAIDIGIENLKTDHEFREASFRAWYQFTGSNENFLYENLKGIGIRASSANILTNYIITKSELEYSKQKEAERKQEIAQEKKQKIEEQKQEIVRKKLEAERIEKEKRLQSRVYDLATTNDKEYAKYKGVLISELKSYIKNKPIENNNKISDLYTYTFTNQVNNIVVYTEKISSTNNSSLFNSFKIQTPPNLQLENISIPIKFTVSDINLELREGTTKIKIKGGQKVKFLDKNANNLDKKLLKDSLDSFSKGTYLIKYRFGKINNDSLNEVEELLIKKPNNSWLIYPLLGGLLVGVAYLEAL